MKPVVIPPRHRPRKKKHRFLKGTMVVVFASALTVVMLHASDTLRVPGNGLLAGVGESDTPERCPKDMTYVPSTGGGFCIDRYEESPGKACPNGALNNQFDTETNLRSPVCFPVSESEGDPWVNVSYHDALALCAKVGKRLPSNSEWYRAALGTPDDVNTSDGCVLGRIGAGEAERTGAHAKCTSFYGAYDMVGNVWEWVDGTITDGTYGSRKLPNEGFVTEADNDGVPVSTGTSSDPVFHNDYFSLITSGVQGMLRGGYWNMTEKAGINAINAATAPSFVGNAVGFRCAREAQ